jgi:cephalosporin hydroxylase
VYNKINNNILNSWESLKISGHRRFFLEDPELVQLMRLAYVRTFGKVKSVSWFEHGAMQCVTDYHMYIESIRDTKPQIIIETGTASGASACFYAEALERINGNKNYLVITIEKYPSKDMPDKIKNNDRIISVIGDACDPSVIAQVKSLIIPGWRVMTTFDSDHSAEHVMGELSSYAEMTSVGCYCIVQDSYLGLYWGGNLTGDEIIDVLKDVPGCKQFDYHGSPLGAIEAFLMVHPEFQVDLEMQRWLITQHPYGWLKRVA